MLTILPGEGPVVGERFVTHPLVRKVCFTGSTRVGKQIMAGCADQVKRVTLELGGKSSNIVFADADIAAAAAAAPVRRLRQRRPGLLRPLADPRRALGLRRVRLPAEPAVTGLRVLDPGRRRPARWARWSRPPTATGSGATSTAPTSPSPAPRPAATGSGCRRPSSSLDDPAHRLWREEVFGPVVAVMAFDGEADAVALANDTEYGLSGSIFTSDLGRGLRVARAVESGNLSVNSHSAVRYWTPFGGYKQSGLGRELGPDAPRVVHRGEERLHRALRVAAAESPAGDSAPVGCCNPRQAHEP